MDQRSASIKTTGFKRQTTFTKSGGFNRSRLPHKAAAAARPRPPRDIPALQAVTQPLATTNGTMGTEVRSDRKRRRKSRQGAGLQAAALKPR